MSATSRPKKWPKPWRAWLSDAGVGAALARSSHPTGDFQGPVTNLSTRTEYEGFEATAGSTFEFSTSLDLAAASLTLPLYGYRCVNEGGPVGTAPEPECYEIEPITVDVDVDWTGIGEIRHDSYGESITDVPGLRFRYLTVSDTRDAIAEGQVAGDGVELGSGTASTGVLLTGDYRETFVTR